VEGRRGAGSLGVKQLRNVVMPGAVFGRRNSQGVIAGKNSGRLARCTGTLGVTVSKRAAGLRAAAVRGMQLSECWRGRERGSDAQQRDAATGGKAGPDMGPGSTAENEIAVAH
jgi:hypothetical protein